MRVIDILFTLVLILDPIARSDANLDTRNILETQFIFLVVEMMENFGTAGGKSKTRQRRSLEDG